MWRVQRHFISFNHASRYTAATEICLMRLRVTGSRGFSFFAYSCTPHQPPVFYINQPPKKFCGYQNLSHGYSVHKIYHQLLAQRFFICSSMLRHFSPLALGHLQGICKFSDMCSLCFNLYGRNFSI